MLRPVSEKMTSLYGRNVADAGQLVILHLIEEYKKQKERREPPKKEL